ncbi:MAG TPA: tyrosine-protein phosphatase [Pedococcus sp.]
MSSIGWLDLDGVVNMRDVGGLPTRDGGTTRSGRLLRSDNLQDLSPDDIRHLVDVIGVSDIVDLRSNAEYHVEGPGPLTRTDLTHHRHSLFRDDETEVSVEDALVLPWQREDTRERLRSHDEDYWASHYLGYLADRPDSVAAALEVVATATGATVVHCAAGKDRTGTVVGIALAVAGVPEEHIVADYVATAERIERIVERLSTRPAYADNLRGRPLDDHLPRPETMTRILEVLEQRHGGAEGWLVGQGWSEEQVERLRARLTR